MDIKPVEKAVVSDVVFEQLVDEIVSGRLAPDVPLPGERELAERFAVNRHAVREALKRVRQAGLVRISHGGKTRVLDWRSNAGLDVLSALASTGALPPARVLHDIVEMRRVVAADAARACAERASEEQLCDVVAAADAYSTGEATEADLRFWSAVIDGSGNVAYRLALNTLLKGFADIGMDTIAGLGLDAELIDADAHVELAHRIADRDGDAAHQYAHDLLGRVVDRLCLAIKETADV